MIFDMFEKEKTSDELLEEFGFDLVQKAKDHSLTEVFGRDKELDAVLKILLKKTKNNPILIGEAGVGKTAIIEHLATKISKGEVPINLLDKKIYILDYPL